MWTEGSDNIEDGLCWFRRLPMANDGNTVMAMYVSFTIPPADLDTRSNAFCLQECDLASKVGVCGKRHMGAEFAGVKPNLALVCHE